MNHDIIAIGASAGGIPVLFELVAGLPADLEAAVFVVLHVTADARSDLPGLLSSRGPLPATHPLHGDEVVNGHIYVAPPDNHLVLRPGFMEIVRGARENGHRPAVDTLFRSAAKAYGSRVIGVVLSGYRDCGSAGMMAVKARGGLSVVQRPDTAAASEMPERVIERVEVDYIVPPAELAPLLARLVRTGAGPEIAPSAFAAALAGDAPRTPAELVCPTCQGVLGLTKSGTFEHFQCHEGHAFTLDSLIREQSEEIERALWAAARALDEGAAISERLVGREPGALGRRFAEQAATQRQQAELIRRILLGGHGPFVADLARSA